MMARVKLLTSLASRLTGMPSPRPPLQEASPVRQTGRQEGRGCRRDRILQEDDGGS